MLVILTPHVLRIICQLYNVLDRPQSFRYARLRQPLLCIVGCLRGMQLLAENAHYALDQVAVIKDGCHFTIRRSCPTEEDAEIVGAV